MIRLYSSQVLSTLQTVLYYYVVHICLNSARRGKTSGRDRFWNGSPTIVNRGLVSRQLDGDIPTNPKDIVEVKVATRRGHLAVDGDGFHICSSTFGDGLLHRFGVVVDGSNSGRLVEVGVMDGILRDHRGQDEILGSRGD